MRHRLSVRAVRYALAWVSAAVVLAACAGQRAEPDAKPSTPAPGVMEQHDDPEIAEFLQIYAAARGEAGCAPLLWDAQAATVATAHSADMARRAYFSHTNPEGASPFDRLRAAGMAFRSAAENIAKSVGARYTHNRWLTSEGHRRNMLDCSFTHHGLGRSGEYWTHVFLQR